MSEKGGQVDSVQSGRFRIEKNRNRVLVSDGSTNLLLLGERLDGTIGYDLAPVGVEVLTAPLSQLVASDRFKTFTIAESNTVTVTRLASHDSGSQTVSVSSLGAPMFFATWHYTSASPNYTQQTPFYLFNTSGTDSGKVTGSRRALYDPDTGLITFIVDASSIAPNYAITEVIEFQYFLLYQNIPS